MSLIASAVSRHAAVSSFILLLPTYLYYTKFWNHMSIYFSYFCNILSGRHNSIFVFYHICIIFQFIFIYFLLIMSTQNLLFCPIWQIPNSTFFTFLRNFSGNLQRKMMCCQDINIYVIFCNCIIKRYYDISFSKNNASYGIRNLTMTPRIRRWIG